MYFIKRLFFIIPTLLIILTINFFIIQIAPGGPVEQAIANIELGQTALLGGQQTAIETRNENSYRGGKGLDAETIEQIKIQYGFDKPILQRYMSMLESYLCFDFGNSLFKNSSVIELIGKAMPVSISLGLWSTLIIYLISIPLGIRKALTDGSSFDIWSSMLIIIGYAIPSFLLALLLIILFASGNYFAWFPLRGLVSIHFDELTLPNKVIDYFRHITLPVFSTVIGGFAGLTMLTKNAFIDEIHKHYVITARAKGLSEQQILYKHVFRNAMLIIISGFPATFIGMFFTGSLLIEIIFSLNGLGLLGYEAILQRDYPVIFATLYIFTLIGLISNILGDLLYTWVDPRINFEARL